MNSKKETAVTATETTKGADGYPPTEAILILIREWERKASYTPRYFYIYRFLHSPTLHNHKEITFSFLNGKTGHGTVQGNS